MVKNIIIAVLLVALAVFQYLYLNKTMELSNAKHQYLICRSVIWEVDAVMRQHGTAMSKYPTTDEKIRNRYQRLLKEQEND